MTSFRIFLVLTLLLLVGCATTKGKYGEDLNQPCRGAEDTIGDSNVVVNTNETKLFYSDVPIKTFSGIQSASLSGSVLTLSTIDRTLHEQYIAPLVATLDETKYKAHPFKSVFYTIFTGGIFILKAPRKFIPYTFGCTEKNLMYLDPDPRQKLKTGKTEWRDTKLRTYNDLFQSCNLDSDCPMGLSCRASPNGHNICRTSGWKYTDSYENNAEKINGSVLHKFLISGFNRDYEYKGENNIDLTQAILATNLTSSTNLKITCLDCDLLGSEEQKLYKSAKKTVELTYDFRPAKESFFIEKALQEKVDKENLIKEKEIAIKEKEEYLNAQKERNGAPINRFKEQCMQLGFKAGTQDFGNCVLELNDAK